MNALDRLLHSTGMKKQKDKDSLVLVPPLLERDHRGRSRMVKSSFDIQFSKLQLKWLFNDYLWPGANGLLRFSPEEDRRITAKARMGSSLEKLGAGAAGMLSVRFQPDPNEYLSFVDLKAASQGQAQIRGCYFDTSTGLGTFARAPLSTAQDNGENVEAGLRYSSRQLSAGVISRPLAQRLTHLWLVRQNGPITMGWQLKPEGPISSHLQTASSDVPNFFKDLHAHSSYALSYSPQPASPSSGRFTATVELRERERLVLSLMHHLAVQRRCRNLLEDTTVVGIANYLDLGLQVVTHLGSPATNADTYTRAKDAHNRSSIPELCFALALQLNKNLLVKARASTRDVAAAAAFKVWWQPSWMVAATAAYDFATQKPRFGLTLHTENYGNIRYERSSLPQRTGSALVQRHVAVKEEIANAEGKGIFVDRAHVNDPTTLGQLQRRSDTYL
ncbi:hypothetical protein WJX73_002243 [Symbiochloris irregularis]|uniref:Uncharacterized protein n=1 Tax=Symbiochloris irregularis TaxID=706552 RepID=A0AAW1NJZ1_9CHLO